MKVSWLLILYFFSTVAFSQSEEKTYTEEEFQLKLSDELDKKIRALKTKNIIDLTKELLDKDRDIEKRKRELDIKEKQLELATKDLSQRVLKFEERQRKLIGCIDNNEKQKKQRITQIIDVVTNMKPDKAAQLLSVQETEISVRILSGIPPERASKIFNLMDKEISARLQKQYLYMKK